MSANAVSFIYSVCSCGITLYNAEIGEMQEIVINDAADDWQDLWSIAESIVGSDEIRRFRKEQEERWRISESKEAEHEKLRRYSYEK